MTDESDKSPISTIVIYGLVFVVCASFAWWAETDTSKPRRALDAMGIHDATVEEGSAINMACASEEIAYDAHGTNANGQQVSVVVCCGVVAKVFVAKACTVRSR